jgi:phosphoribosylanthranilate isomerase
MKIKICGITTREDAHAAVDAGADALGFVFVPASKRYLSRDAAASIIAGLPPFVIPVGVFVNEGRKLILETIRRTGIRCLQLHGEEPPEETAGYPVPVIKGFRVGPEFAPPALSSYRTSAYLLDAYVEGTYGGTGKRFDWNLAVASKEFGRVILSGGLTADNVGEAVRFVHPYAVDVSSGVEAAPGIKDHAQVEAFIRAARGAGG